MGSVMHQGMGLAAAIGVLITADGVRGEPSIAPANDGIGTTVQQQGDRYDIGGGTRAGNNLFHSFERLGLSSQEIANFLATPDLNAIVGRITGGDPSVIDGLIRVSGGNPNLYLMNPAGIVFGAGARLDVPASFTATTATSLGFSDGGWFPATGTVDFSGLGGSLDWLEFGSLSSGSLVNRGQLSVPVGQGLWLISGSQVGPAGQPNQSVNGFAISAVSGTNRVRIAPPNSPLGLEVALPAPEALAGRSLPELLVGGQLTSATRLVPHPDGSVSLRAIAASQPTGNPTGSLATLPRLNEPLPASIDLRNGFGQSSHRVFFSDRLGFLGAGGAGDARSGLGSNPPTALESTPGLQFAPSPSTTGDSSNTLSISPLSATRLSAVNGLSQLDLPSPATTMTVTQQDGSVVGTTGNLLQFQVGSATQAIEPLNVVRSSVGQLNLIDQTSPQNTLTANGPIPPTTPTANVGASSVTFNPAIATQVLRSSGQLPTHGTVTLTAPARSSLMTAALGTAAPGLPINQGLPQAIDARVANGHPNLTISELERFHTNDFNTYLGRPLSTSALDLPALQAILQQAEAQTGVRTAFVYSLMRDDHLNVLVVLPRGPLVSRMIKVPRQQVIQATIALRSSITNPVEHQSDGYLVSAQQLYQWLIDPIADSLAEQGIESLVFSMDRGLRSLPMAALHDGRQFLIERYSLGVMPSASLLDARFQSLRQASVLSFGMSQFQQLPPLPAVPLELAVIGRISQSSSSFLNESFTFANLKQQRQAKPYPILHLATHADFQPGDLSNSFVQLWDRRLAITELRQLKLNDPPLELLVLSACRTAVGDDTTELGFSGLAVEAGVKSVVASLWSVHDSGTLTLMTHFYQALRSAPTKAEALRQAQLSLLRRATPDPGASQSGLREHLADHPVLAAHPEPIDLPLSHPYYWASFMTIGSPW